MSSVRPRVLVVYKKSAYQIYVRERRHARVAALMRRGSPAVAGLQRAHKHHQQTLAVVRRALLDLDVQVAFRRRSERVSADGFDLIVTVGGDGTLLWASQMIGPACPVLAINSAPADSVGYFCAASGETAARALRAALAGKLRTTRLTRLQVEIDDELVSSRVLNDVLFTHYCPAATTRYGLRLRGRSEVQRSSGVWVATAAGSTAAIRSAGGRVQPIAARRLQFVVREPYTAPGRRLRILRGFVGESEQLEIQSYMRAGRLYVDGPHFWRTVEIGSVLRIRRSHEPLLLLGFK